MHFLTTRRHDALSLKAQVEIAQCAVYCRHGNKRCVQGVTEKFNNRVWNKYHWKTEVSLIVDVSSEHHFTLKYILN
jgi:hypothetical protein